MLKSQKFIQAEFAGIVWTLLQEVQGDLFFNDSIYSQLQENVGDFSDFHILFFAMFFLCFGLVTSGKFIQLKTKRRLIVKYLFEYDCKLILIKPHLRGLSFGQSSMRVLRSVLWVRSVRHLPNLPPAFQLWNYYSTHLKLTK